MGIGEPAYSRPGLPEVPIDPGEGGTGLPSLAKVSIATTPEPNAGPLPSFRAPFSSLMLNETSPIIFIPHDLLLFYTIPLKKKKTKKMHVGKKHSKDETLLKQISVSIPLLTLKAFKRSGSRLNPSFSSLASSSSSSSSSSLLPVEEASSAIKESSREWSDRPGLCKGDHLAHWRVSHKHNSRNFLFFSIF